MRNLGWKRVLSSSSGRRYLEGLVDIDPRAGHEDAEDVKAAQRTTRKIGEGRDDTREDLLFLVEGNLERRDAVLPRGKGG